MNTTKNPWQTLDSDVRYENNWLALRHENVITPTGTAGIYGVVSFKNKAMGVVPIDADGNTYLVGQYRYTLNECTWEIPEGGGMAGKSVLHAAKRELKEEAGLVAGSWKTIVKTHLSNSVSDEVGFIFLARDLREVDREPEESEADMKVWKLPFEKALKMVLTGKITDALSVMGILRVARMLKL